MSEYEVGMEVVVYNGFYNRPIRMATIVNISPKLGHITIQHKNGEKEKFSKLGFAFGGSWYSPYIKPATDERKKEFYDASAISRCKACIDYIGTQLSRNQITADMARQIVKALGQIDCPTLLKCSMEVDE